MEEKTEATAVVHELLHKHLGYQEYEDELRETTERFIHRLVLIARHIGRRNVWLVYLRAKTRLLTEKINFAIKELGGQQVCPNCSCPHTSIKALDLKQVKYECNSCHAKWTGPRSIPEHQNPEAPRKLKHKLKQWMGEYIDLRPTDPATEEK